MSPPTPPKLQPPLPQDPRELCLICKKPKDPRRPGSTWNGMGENVMMVWFYLHDECRPVLENRRMGAK